MTTKMNDSEINVFTEDPVDFRETNLTNMASEYSDHSMDITNRDPNNINSEVKVSQRDDD